MVNFLVESLPTWALAFLIVGGTMVLSLVGFLVVVKFHIHAPDHSSDAMASGFVVLTSTLLGVLLVFVVVSLYEEYLSAKDSVRSEATALAQLVRDGWAFPAPVESALDCRIAAYIREVRGNEWALMAKERSSPRALSMVERLYTTVSRYDPHSARERTFYRDGVNHLDDLVSARRTRLQHVEGAIPAPLWLLLVVAAAVALLTTYTFAQAHARTQLLLVALSSGLIGTSFLVAMLLDYPFAGAIAVSSGPFHQGVLGHLCSLTSCSPCP